MLLCASASGPAAVQQPGTEWNLLPPNPVAQKTKDTLEGFEKHACAACHQTIAKEWAATRHAQAWVESLYIEELAKVRKPAKCHGCHAPRPLLITGVSKKPKLRSVDPHFGVDCNACHLDANGAVHGPTGIATEAHVSVQSGLFTDTGSNELCYGCHSRSIGPVIGIARDFDDEDLGDSGFSCVGCHMASAERPVANDPETGVAGPLRPGRSHALQTPRDPHFLRQAFDLRVEQRQTIKGLVIANRAGHRVPGLNDRVLQFELEALGADNSVLKAETLTISRETPLDLGEELWFVLPAGAENARVRAKHTAKSLECAVLFCDESLPVDS